MAKGSGGINETKSLGTRKDDMGIDQVPKTGKPFKGSGEQNISKGQPSKSDSFTGKTKNKSGEAIT